MPITPAKELVAAAKTRIRSLNPLEAQAAAAADALLVDIRDVRELEREGRIEGAFHAPRGMLEFWIDPESPYHRPQLDARPLVLFCASSWRSALAADMLQRMGVEDVAEIEGGFTAWREAGLPILMQDVPR